MRAGEDRGAGAELVDGYVPTALVVDDDRSWLEWLDFHLTRAGWRAVCVDCAMSALSCFDEHEPDAVILDELMPGRTGSEIAAQLRDRGFSGPMMLLSASSDQALLLRCARLSVESVSKLSQAALFAIMAEWRAELVAWHPPEVIDLRDAPVEVGGRLRRLLHLGRHS